MCYATYGIKVIKKTFRIEFQFIHGIEKLLFPTSTSLPRIQPKTFGFGFMTRLDALTQQKNNHL